MCTVSEFRARVGVVIACALMLAVIGTSVAHGETWGYITQWGTAGTGNSQFSSPSGIAADANGANVYVADTGNNRVQKFSSAGVYSTQWGTAGTGNGQFNAPTGVAATGNGGGGRLYVADFGNNRIQQFNSNTGAFLWVSPSTDVVAGATNGDFNGPTGIAAAGAGGGARVYVMDGNNNRLQTFTTAGVYSAQWGTGGTGNNQYSGATGVAANSTLAVVAIADTGNNRYQKTNLTGTYNSQFGTTGTGDGQFTNPGYVGMHATTGDIFVTDRDNNRVQKISAAGAYVTQWGTSGSGNGQFNTPRGINVDVNGNVYVVDSGNNRIQKFGLVPEVSAVVRAVASPTAATTVTYTVTFNTGVTGVDATDFTLTTTGVSGASVTTVAVVSTSVYTVTVNTGTGTGTIRLDVADNDTILSATAGATTLNLLAAFTTGEVYTVLKTPPTITLGSAASDPVNSAISVTATLSADSTNFVSTDITPTNGAVSGFAGSGSVYTFTLTPSANGAFSAIVNANSFTDGLANQNTVSNSLGRTYDTVSPGIALSSAAPDPTNAAIPVSVTLDESSTDFDVGDIAVTNGAAGSFSGSGTAYTFTITPAGLGAVTATVNAGQFTDAAGNFSTASNTISRTYNNVKPAINLDSTAPDPINGAISVTASLSAASTNFVSTDVTPTNAVVSAFAGSGDTYTFTLTPTADGAFSAVVNANRFTDSALNLNTASNVLSRTYDSVSPDVTLSSAAPDPTNASIDVSVLLSESSADFDVGDISVVNGTAGGFSGSGDTYSFTVTPAGVGSVTATVNAGQFTDAAGNLNTISNTIDRTYNNASPAITLTSTASDPVNAAISVTASLSAASTDFAEIDITPTNAVVSAFAGSGDTYTFTLTPSTEGSFSADVNAGVFADAATNLNTASNTLSRTYDGTPPDIALSSAAPDPTNAAIDVSVLLSESSADFDVGDISVTNGAAGSFSGSGVSYSFTITPAGLGLVSATVNAGQFTDAAGNLNTVSNTIDRTYNNTSPAITLTSTDPDPVNAAISVTASLSAPSVNFTTLDITRTNATVSAFVGSGDTYTFTLTPSAEGSFSAEVDAGRFTDAVTNLNTASNVLSRTYDITQPDIALSSAASDPTNADVTVDVLLSETSPDFDLADITVTNGVAGSFSGSGTTFSFTIAPAGQGPVSATVDAGKFADAAGNLNTTSNTIDRIYDGIAPGIVLSSSDPDPTNASISVDVALTEPSADFADTDLIVTNGTVGGFAGAGDTYSFTITPAGQGAVTALVDAGGFSDEAGNLNTASNTLSRAYDTVVPAITLSTIAPDPTDAEIAVDVLLSEFSTDFAIDDLVITNGVAGSFSGADDTYFFIITPAANGLVSVTVDAGAFSDAAGNANAASNTIERTYDNPSPSITLATAAPGLVNAAISVTATLGTPSVDFDAGDITPVNAAVSDFAGGGDAYSFTLTPSADGVFSVAVDAGVFTDAASNANTASNVLERTYDGILPTATLSSAAPDPTNADVLLTIELSEPSVDFEEIDITVTNGVASGFAGSVDAYSVTITPAGPGLVTAQVDAGTFSDAATNGNSASSLFSRTFDADAPSILLSTTSPDPTNTDILVEVALSESSANFEQADITVVNGAVGSFTGGGDTYGFAVTPAAIGPVTVTVDADTFSDAAGNLNLASNSISVVYNGTSPAVILTTTAPASVNSAVQVSASLSVASVNFAAGDILTTNAAVINFAGGADAYSFTLSPLAQGAFSAAVIAGTFTDASSNPNSASNVLTHVFDSLVPVVSVLPLVTSDSRPPLAGAINDATVPVSVTVGSQSHPATNHGDGSWSLADNTLDSLASGTYNVIVEATDSAGNTGVDATSGELTVDLAISIFPGGIIEEGDTVELTGPEGTSYRWQRNGVDVVNAPPRVTGITSRTLRLSPALELDSGSYLLVFNDGAKILIESAPFELVVHPAASLPVAGPVGLVAMALLMVAGYAMKRRK